MLYHFTVVMDAEPLGLIKHETTSLEECMGRRIDFIIRTYRAFSGCVLLRKIAASPTAVDQSNKIK